MRLEYISKSTLKARAIREEGLRRDRKKTGRITLAVGIYNLVIVSIGILLLLFISSKAFVDAHNEEKNEDGGSILGPDFTRFIGKVFLVLALILAPFALVYSLLIVSAYYVLKGRKHRFSEVISCITIPTLSISLLMNFLFTIFIGPEITQWAVYIIIPAMLIPMLLKVVSIIYVLTSLPILKELREAEPGPEE